MGIVKDIWPQSYPVTTEHIGSTTEHIVIGTYARATSSLIMNLDRDDRIRSAPHRRPDVDNPVQTYLIIYERETRSWQIVPSEIEQ